MFQVIFSFAVDFLQIKGFKWRNTEGANKIKFMMKNRNFISLSGSGENKKSWDEAAGDGLVKPELCLFLSPPEPVAKDNDDEGAASAIGGCGFSKIPASSSWISSSFESLACSR